MIDRNRLSNLYGDDRVLLCLCLDQFIGVVPGYLAAARAALALGDADAVDEAIHNGKNAVCLAGAVGRLREAAVEALAMCGTPTAPRLPDDPERFLRLLDEFDVQHTLALPDAVRLREEFAR